MMLTLADEGQCDAATQAGHPACLTSLAPNIGTSSSEGRVVLGPVRPTPTQPDQIRDRRHLQPQAI